MSTPISDEQRRPHDQQQQHQMQQGQSRLPSTLPETTRPTMSSPSPGSSARRSAGAVLSTTTVNITRPSSHLQAQPHSTVSANASVEETEFPSAIRPFGGVSPARATSTSSKAFIPTVTAPETLRASLAPPRPTHFSHTASRSLDSSVAMAEVLTKVQSAAFSTASLSPPNITKALPATPLPVPLASDSSSTNTARQSHSSTAQKSRTVAAQKSSTSTAQKSSTLTAQQIQSKSQCTMHSNRTTSDDTFPLTCSPLVDAELRPLLSYFIRDFVRSWFAPMISPTDTDFERVIDGTVMRHAVCAMERRLLNVDWISLVLDDLPALIGRHVSDYRMCFEKQGTAYGASGKLSVEQLFHLHQPHIALVSTSHAEEYVREWVDIVMGVMSVDHDGLLCDGDRDVMALRYLLREILTGVVSQALDKMSEPDYIYELVLVLLDSFEVPSPAISSDPVLPSELLEKLQRDREILNGRDSVRRRKTAAEASSTTGATVPLDEPGEGKRARSYATMLPSRPSMAELSRTHDQNESTPAFTVKIRSIFSRLDSFTLGDDPSITHLEAQPRAAAHAEEPLDRGWLTALNELFEFDVHNPWLWSQINLVLLPAVRLFFGGAWKRLMLRVVRSATSEDRVAKAIRAARTSFWPDGVWDARPRVRTPAEQRETRRAVERRLKALPSDAVRFLFGDETINSGVEVFLAVLDHRHLNRHLFFAIMDLFAAHIVSGGNARESSIPPPLPEKL